MSDFLTINGTLSNLTEYATGSTVLTGVIIFMVIVFIIEMIELPIYARFGVYMITALGLSSLLGFPAVVSALILVAGGLFYFFLLRDAWRS